MDTLVTLLQVGSVFAILLGAAWALKRYGNKTGRTGTLEVVARTPVTPRSSVAVIRLGDKAYMVGVTETTVNLIAEVDPSQLPEPEPSPTFAAQLRTASGTDTASQPTTLGAAVVSVTRRAVAHHRARRADTGPDAAAQPTQTRTVAATAPAQRQPQTKTTRRPATNGGQSSKGRPATKRQKAPNGSKGRR